MINTLLTMSLTGSAVVLAWLAVDKLSRDRLSALWHDRILRLALFFMLVPVGRLWAAARELLTNFLTGRTVDVPAVMPVNPALDLPAATPGAVVIPNVVPDIPVTPPVAQSAAVSVSVDVFWLLTLIWGLGAAVVLCYKLWCYWRFKKLLGKERRPLSQEDMEGFWDCKAELGVSGVVGVFINPAVPTPLATGLIWPVILLPDVPLEREELRYLLLHELTHIKRRDLWVRFFSLCGLVLHWYNPLMYLLNQRIKERSEQSCDEQVARSMSKEERLAYGSMLLKMVTNPAVGPSEWAVTLSTKESIQQRLSRVVKAGKLTRMDKAVAVVTAVGLLCCGTVMAVTVKEPLNIEEKNDPAQEQERVQLPDSLLSLEQVDTVEKVEYSMITIGETVYESYLDNRGVARLKDAIGNGDMLANGDYLVLPTLENGKYPMNSKGETYGYQQLADFVGESPDLIAVVNGWDVSGTNNLDGYVWWEDYYANFSDPAVAAKYELSPEGISKDARAEREATWWRIPMYDAEHNLIGSYDIYEGKYQRHGNLIWWMQNSWVQSVRQKEEARTGTTLSNHGKHLPEIPYSYLTQEQRELLSELPGGTYPQNSKGEYYGPGRLKNYLQIEPDLISAIGTNGEEGFVWWEDLERRFTTLEELADVSWTENGYLIPLYDCEHNQIGWREERIGISTADAPGVELNKQTVEAIWAQIK